MRRYPKSDLDRIVALVDVLTSLANGDRVSVGVAASQIFGWGSERVSSAIENAVKRGYITPSAGGNTR